MASDFSESSREVVEESESSRSLNGGLINRRRRKMRLEVSALAVWRKAVSRQLRKAFAPWAGPRPLVIDSRGAHVPPKED